jgi:hypothetical protein
MAHVVHLPLSRDVARNSARVLNVLLPVEDLPDGAWFVAYGIPKVHRKDQ